MCSLFVFTNLLSLVCCHCCVFTILFLIIVATYLEKRPLDFTKSSFFTRVKSMNPRRRSLQSSEGRVPKGARRCPRSGLQSGVRPACRWPNAVSGPWARSWPVLCFARGVSKALELASRIPGILTIHTSFHPCKISLFLHRLFLQISSKIPSEMTSKSTTNLSKIYLRCRPVSTLRLYVLDSVVFEPGDSVTFKIIEICMGFVCCCISVLFWSMLLLASIDTKQNHDFSSQKHSKSILELIKIGIEFVVSVCLIHFV